MKKLFPNKFQLHSNIAFIYLKVRVERGGEGASIKDSFTCADSENFSRGDAYLSLPGGLGGTRHIYGNFIM